ncbi:MAG: PHP domain-containing protein [Candidatus Marinimicrobia bacterium]|nr:PHP domain-containing protein [Candidatus Neomarinimicrobiota bacterium]
MRTSLINITIYLFVLIGILKSHDSVSSRKINFPDIKGYKTLVCDLHMHSVFSDGSVWPDIRIEEAKKDGLDVIATTEHIEYQPWKADIPNPDRNRSFEYHKYFAKGTDILVVNGSEITREMPPGHANAIFIKDANKLIVDDPVEAFKEARKQDAFIFWNHPYWASQSPDASVPLNEINLKLIEDGLIEGIEIVNDTTYSNHAFQIALDYNLTVIGTSDIHGIVDWQYKIPSGGHRPATLVFSRDKTEGSLKNALRKGQTVVWFKEKLIGKANFLTPLINSSLKVKSARYIKNTTVAHVVLENKSGAPYILRNQSKYDFYNITDLVTISANSSVVVDVRTIDKKRKFELEFEVINALIEPSKHPVISIIVQPTW